MAKKKKNAPMKLRDQARKKLMELGFERIEEDFRLFEPPSVGDLGAFAELAVFDADEPVVLFASGVPGEAAHPALQEDAKFKAGLGAAGGKSFRFVWIWDG